ncbi:hypothetical protein K523DRAFT_351751 [Schizophyllum commune Tattone D]|nr:hypothetical protein K523DRAFT_351751 [Schizophyllum commune Tattone D]
MAFSATSRGSISGKIMRAFTAPFTSTRLVRDQWGDDPENGLDARNEDTPRYTNKRQPSDTPTNGPTSTRSSIDTSNPVPQAYWDVKNNDFRNKSAEDEQAWQGCTNVVGKYDTTDCQVQCEQIDTLLVFAGLFSGVATAFIMEGYKWMIEEPEDTSAEYLRQILALLSNTTVPSITRSSGRPPIPDDIIDFINGLWFSSLTLSLSSALIGIVSKQWLREYLRDAGRSQRTNLAVRQVKFQGLTRWCVRGVITSIPLLLQTALFLFLAGVVYLLWHIQQKIALVITILGALITVFFIVTTVMPAIQFICCHMGWSRLHTSSQIPFKSAQAWLFLRITLFISNSAAWIYHILTNGIKHDRIFVPPFPTHAAWPQFDLDWTQRRDESAQWSNEPSSVALCLGFIELNFEHPSLRKWIWGCLWSMRGNVTDAKYVLQCIRRIPDVKSNFPSPASNSLASTVLPLAQPDVATLMTSELLLHAILESDDATSVEHLIRILNNLMHRGIEVPGTVYTTLHNTLSKIPGASSTAETRLQLFYVVQNTLRRSQHTEILCGPFTKLITTIVMHLSQGETQETPTYVGRELSLDVAADVSEWLERYPEPIAHLGAYKARLVWSAKTAVLLARRLASFKELDTIENIPKWHPRFPTVCALVDLVFAKATLIPMETWPSWTSSEKSDMESLRQVKAALDAARQESITANGETPLAAPYPAARPMPWMVGISGELRSSNTARPQQDGVHFDQDCDEQNESSTTESSTQASGSDGCHHSAQDAGPVASTSSRTTAVEQAPEQPVDNGNSYQAATDRLPSRTAARQDSQQTAVSQDSDQTMVSYASRRTSPSPDLSCGTISQDTGRKSFGTTRSLSLSPEGTILEQDEPPSASTVEEFSQELDDMPSRLEGDIKRRPSRETGAPEPQGNGSLPSPSDNSASRSAKAILPSRANGSEPSQGGGTPSEQIMESSTPSTGAPSTPSDARAAPQESEGRSLSSRGSEIPSPGGVGGDVPPRNGSKPRWRI